MKDLTSGQKKVYDYIVECAENGRVPSVRELCEATGFKSTSTVAYHLKALEERGLPTPKGILLAGVPGCGKSLSAKSISANWKLPLYRLDFATVQGSYVGQSEQQLKDALTTAENVSPCILWIDEIEIFADGSIEDKVKRLCYQSRMSIKSANT